MKSHPKLIVIIGLTASGKSDLGIFLALRLSSGRAQKEFNIKGVEIISADSRQVYRGMDIGTGKVTKQEQRLARHWMLDIASPTRQYSVARFKREAQRTIRNITRRDKLPIICGGTGFWIDTLVYDLSLPPVKPNAKLRAQLRKLPTTQLYTRLKKLDPVRAATIDRYNSVRLIRALEIVMTTGRPVPTQVHLLAGETGSEKFKVKSRWEVLYLGISIPKEKLVRRIEKRLDARLKQGMITEVRRLHIDGVSWKRLESFGLEYRWVTRFIRHEITRAQMRDRLLHDIIVYAKRQMTWFKRNKDIHWLNASAGSTQAKSQALGLVQKFLKS
ncbi:MAG: tRNA (adenosine(37)-N6)-dimethylallyltransferase MiaA [Patescibacteria group bacterium]